MSENNEFSFENPQYRKTYWHTCSHVMAQAVKRLWPEVKLAIGPSIDNGFYYDFDAPFNFTQENLDAIEAEMRKICKEKLKLERFELPREEAIKYMQEKDEPYKVELINDLPEDAHISFYTQGEFTDLCAGPHLDSTGRIKGNAIKLTACNAAYWRGDSSRQTLQRIYGVAFPKKEQLDEYLARIEEAKKRDHRKLGKELELFCFSPRVGAGLPLWLPKGAALRDRLEHFLRNVQKQYGYLQVITPHIGMKDLYVTSGHYAKYGKDSFQPIHTPDDSEEFLLIPSFTAFFKASIASRRALRTLTLAVSPSPLHCFASCLRRSSVKGGIPIRIISPLFSGMIPNSESIIAFSITRNILLSQGFIAILRASGVVTAATLLMGTMLP